MSREEFSQSASFKVPVRPTSWNRLISVHWRVVKKAKENLAASSRASAILAGWRRECLYAKGPFTARFTALSGPMLGRGRGSQRAQPLDCDNVFVKPILDALKGWAFEEDNPDIIEEVRLKSRKVDLEADQGILVELLWNPLAGQADRPAGAGYSFDPEPGVSGDVAGGRGEDGRDGDAGGVRGHDED